MAMEPGINCALEVALKDFVELLKHFRVGKKLGKRNMQREEAVFGFDNGRLTVEAVGVQHSIVASGSWSGFTRIRFVHFDALRRAPPSQEPLQLKYAAGRLRIGSTSLPADWHQEPESSGSDH